MGSDSSKIMREHELTPQTRFPRVINTRFVYDRMVSLRLQNGFWSHSDPQALEILDIDSNKVMFKIPPQSTDPSSVRKQLLLDLNGVPIVTMDEFPVEKHYATYIPAVPLPASVAVDKTTIANRALCYLETSTRPLEKKLCLKLKDPLTGRPVTITVEGEWRKHRALFFIDHHISFKRGTIARAYISPADKESNKRNGGVVFYQVDVAPGVDVALIVLACAAMDEALAKKKSRQIEDIPTDETTKMLAQRHHGMMDTEDARVGRGRPVAWGAPRRGRNRT